MENSAPKQNTPKRKQWIFAAIGILVIVTGIITWGVATSFMGKSSPQETTISTIVLNTATMTPATAKTYTSTLSPTSTWTPTATYTPTETPTATATPIVCIVSTDLINVRTGPNTSFPIIAQVAHGQFLKVIGRHPGNHWLLVQLDSGQLGWIFYYGAQCDFDITILPTTTGTSPLSTPSTPTPEPGEPQPYGLGLLAPPSLPGIAPTATQNPARWMLSLISVAILLVTAIASLGIYVSRRQVFSKPALSWLIQIIASLL